jgi:hypothetical protein
MKQLPIMLSFLFACFISNAQMKDTVFLQREITEAPNGFYHAVYIDTSAKTRNLITDESFGAFDTTSYLINLSQIKTTLKLNYIPKEIPKKWVPIYLYKNEYYLYAPSEWGNHRKFVITDSTTIDFDMEGIEPSKIVSINQVSTNEILIKRKNNWQGDSVKIKMINPDLGIAIFTFCKTRTTDEEKRLMVSVDKACRFKTIVNYCNTDKVSEWEFDNIDFSRLEY